MPTVAASMIARQHEATICVGAVVSAGSIDTRLPHMGHDLLTFKCNHRPLSNSGSASPMPTVKLRASTILGAFEHAQTELVGKAVVLSDGKAGTVESGLTKCTDYEFLSEATMGSGLCPPSNTCSRTEIGF